MARLNAKRRRAKARKFGIAVRERDAQHREHIALGYCSFVHDSGLWCWGQRGHTHVHWGYVEGKRVPLTTPRKVNA